jgi:hypothetical protein
VLNDLCEFWGIEIKNSLNLILGFDFSKGFLNLKNSCVKSNWFCKGLR